MGHYEWASSNYSGSFTRWTSCLGICHAWRKMCQTHQASGAFICAEDVYISWWGEGICPSQGKQFSDMKNKTKKEAHKRGGCGWESDTWVTWVPAAGPWYFLFLDMLELQLLESVPGQLMIAGPTVVWILSWGISFAAAHDPILAGCSSDFF